MVKLQQQPCVTMHRIVQRRRAGPLRSAWSLLGAVALALAASSAVFTAWTWRQTRDLTRSVQNLRDRLDQGSTDPLMVPPEGRNPEEPFMVNLQRKAIVQLFLEKRELLENLRVKREEHIPETFMSYSKTFLPFSFVLQAGGTKGKNGNGRKVASHFEITKDSFKTVGTEGIIKGWTEQYLNMSQAVEYNTETGTFKILRRGVYFLYCQVHFSEQASQYVKLEVTVPQGPSLQCMEGYSTTPTTGFKQFHFLKPCQVSGLLLLEKGAELKAKTGSEFTLKDSGKHYFGLFKVN
ncbi:tumor necrosis factor ligand superfamily member 12 isoform X1 [Tachysurus fulvidraco]|uniref:tumor necrosis factor ligand superfamily member 12 isoform X1 n=1 Tax=Tachysurus fulvidraco TaxID=1234273 RepID=UPI000F4FC665|nr:tumor necrosis factor ligand superfamily member 12 isoform X1 [Tachysurus fulvidraco]